MVLSLGILKPPVPVSLTLWLSSSQISCKWSTSLSSLSPVYSIQFTRGGRRQLLHKLQRNHCYVIHKEGLWARHPWESGVLSSNNTVLASVWLLERALPSYGSSGHLGNYSGIIRDQSCIEARFLGHTESFRRGVSRIVECKLFHQGINLHIWKVVDQLYSSLTSKVFWRGTLSGDFPALQGVRQGSILSTGLYKLYINELLLLFEDSKIGTSIGTVYTGCPTVTDDLTLSSNDDYDTQSMLDIAYSYVNRERYVIHPEKSVIIKKDSTEKPSGKAYRLEIGRHWDVIVLKCNSFRINSLHCRRNTGEHWWQNILSTTYLL